MRVSVLIGFVLIAMGFVALYQVKNGFLMSSISKVYYAPPADAEPLQAAFKELGDKPAADGAFLLRQVAQARVVCTLRQTGELPDPPATEAFRRLNLMLLGAGIGASSPVVDPNIHYIGEIRRSFLRESAPWRVSKLNRGEIGRLDELFEALTAIKHPAYSDLPMGDGFNHFALRNLVETLRKSGEAVHACVVQGKDA